MGQIPANYEENKQFLSVTNRSRYTVHAFSPCVVIAGESGGDNLLYVHSVIDRDIDADFQGQLYLLAISGPAEIPPGGSGRVSTDLPLIAQIQPTRTGDGIDDSEYQDFAYFFWNFQYNYLQPSPDGRGFQYLPTPVIPKDYPYSLGYWHWVDSLNSRFFEVAQFLDGEAEAMRKVRRGEPVLAYLREIGDHWYRGGYGWSSFTFWGAAGDAIEFEFGNFLTGSHFNRIPEDANLDDYRVLENPSENLQIISNSFRYWWQRSMFQIDGESRVAFSNYGLYEIEISSVIEPVISASAFSRFASGAQVSSLPPQSSVDNWQWIYEDLVILINRHDFDTAISRCPVHTMEHRQPFEVREMTIAQHAPSNSKFPYLWPVNRDGDTTAERLHISSFGNPVYNHPHITSRFVLQIGRPAKLGTYKGMAKTVLEFKAFNRSAATTGSLRGYSIVHIKRLNSKVDILE